jgi:hypothetical protein
VDISCRHRTHLVQAQDKLRPEPLGEGHLMKLDVSCLQPLGR